MTTRHLKPVWIVLLIAAISACTSTQSRRDALVAPDVDTAKRQIIVTVPQARAASGAPIGGPGKRYLRRGGYRASAATHRTLDQIAEDYDLVRVDGWLIRSLGVYCEVYQVADAGEVDELVRQLDADPRVDLAQPVQMFATLSTGYDDPYLPMQSAVHRLQVPQAHRWATGDGIRVAVVDSAVDRRHPDLRGQIAASRDFSGRKAPAADGEIHGTAVAGIIASVVNNHEGIVGVAPDVRILALRACWQVKASSAAASCSSFTLAKALEFIIEEHPHLVNLSLAGPPDPLLNRLLARAQRAGIVIVAAEGATTEAFPVSQPGILVAGLPGEAAPAGAAHRVTAPGEDILTTTPGAGYDFLSGSSLAAAHVSAVAALLLEHQPSLDAENLAALMRSDEGADAVNACSALARLLSTAGCGSRVAELGDGQRRLAPRP